MPTDLDRMTVGDRPLAFLRQAGEMARRIREHSWDSTPLGNPEGWPLSLQTLVGVMLAAGQPMFLVWGPEQLWFYNDAFMPILGRKHPAALDSTPSTKSGAKPART